jgi:hypothetical protein
MPEMLQTANRSLHGVHLVGRRRDEDCICQAGGAEPVLVVVSASPGWNVAELALQLED